MKMQFPYYVKKALLLITTFIVPYVLLTQNDFPTKRIMDILIDGSDLWIVGDASVIKYDKTTGEEMVYRPFHTGSLYFNTVLDLNKDHEGNLWTASYRNGIGKFDGKDWTIYSHIQGNFPQNTTNTIIVDNDNHKWIGTYPYLVEFNDKK